METLTRHYDGLTYTLHVRSATDAQLDILETTGTLLRSTAYVGPAAQVRALVAWTQATGLVRREGR